MRNNLLHNESGPGTRWTTVNFAEVQPGVLTPLGYTWWSDPCEKGTRGAFADAGVIGTQEISPPASVDDRLTGIFYGRYAGNLTTIGRLADLTPGTSGEAFEVGLFGHADPAAERISSRRRYPVVMAKMPIAVMRLPGRLARLRAEVDSWWRTCTTESPGLPEQRLTNAAEVVSRAMRVHILTTLVAQGCFDRVVTIAAGAGYSGLELELTTGLGGLEEIRVAADLWAVSRCELSLADFLAAHGYHGPSEGELSSQSWRQDPGPVERAARTYSDLPDDQAPLLREVDRRRVRLDAERRLVGAAPQARAVLPMLRKFMPLREVAKASFIQAVDVGRHAAHQIGETLCRAGCIDRPGDVFMLTLDEVLRGSRQDWNPVVTARRQEREGFLSLALPERWTGQPTPIQLTQQKTRQPIIGIPVSPGVVEGTARVVIDPADAPDLGDGDVLVCETTDPSWVILFQFVAAVVIDVGGVLSHGAIVARELGIPGVINVRNGTREIRDGDRIRVDGAKGVVEILS